jgi:hypothetical protein
MKKIVEKGGIMKKVIKTNIDKQEEIVGILYTFHENQKKHKPDSRYTSFKTKTRRYKTINTHDVGVALKKILKVFGYSVISIQ